MYNNHGKQFGVTLLVSFAIHIFILTFLFTIPEVGEEHEYKKIKVKIGTNIKTVADNVAMARQYTQYNPSAGKTQNKIQSIEKNNSKESLANYKLPKLTSADDKQSSNDNVTSEAIGKLPDKLSDYDIISDSKMQNSIQTARVEDDTSKTQYSNFHKSKDDNKDNSGDVLGNSENMDVESIVSYEQILPLWLNKFRRYPKNIPKDSLGQIIKGEVFIKIDRSGKVLLSKVIKSTGYAEFDKSLINMIDDANPVLPVPLDYYADKKTFSYKIEFEF